MQRFYLINQTVRSPTNVLGCQDSRSANCKFHNQAHPWHMVRKFDSCRGSGELYTVGVLRHQVPYCKICTAPLVAGDHLISISLSKGIQITNLYTTYTAEHVRFVNRAEA